MTDAASACKSAETSGCTSISHSASVSVRTVLTSVCTPTLVVEEIAEVLNALKTAFSLDGPVAIETIPSDVTIAKARRIKQLGIEYVSHRLEKLFWLYWRLYEIEVPKREYQERFKADFPWDFMLLLRLLELLGFGRQESGDRFVLSSRGADWIHLLQNQYALDYVNKIWSGCQVIPWPNKVRL